MKVVDIHGCLVLDAKVFVEFKAMIGGELHDLAITSIEGAVTRLTHVGTGASMAHIHSTDVAIGGFNWESIGLKTLEQLFIKFGEQRVAAAIRTRELKNANSHKCTERGPNGRCNCEERQR